MQEQTAVALLKAAANDPRAAERLLSACSSRALFAGDEPHARVLRAVKVVLEATEHACVRPDLVAEVLGEDAPAWLSEPLGAEVREFGVHLQVATADYDRSRLRDLARSALDELKELNEMTPETRGRLAAFLELPAAGQIARRRATSFKAVAQRSSGQSGLINTGFPPLDDQMRWDFGAPIAAPGNRFPGGYGAGNLVVVGAESGVGKTTFSIEMALRSVAIYNAVHGTKRSLVVFSEEQSAEEIVSRASLKHEGGYWRRHFEEGGWDAHFLDSADYGVPSPESVVSMTVEVVRETVVAGKEAGLSPQEIRGRLPLVIVVDYAKLFAPPSVPLVQGIDALARTLKGRVCRGQAFACLSMEELVGYEPAVILPTQVMRPKTTPRHERGEWRPTKDDLADCRAIRDHADMLFLLHREAGRAEVSIAKARRGVARADVWTPMHVAGARWFSSAKEAEALGGPDYGRYLAAAEAAREARRASLQRRPS